MRTTAPRVIAIASIVLVGTGFFQLNQGSDQNGLIMIVFGLVCTLLALLAEGTPAARIKAH